MTSVISDPARRTAGESVAATKVEPLGARVGRSTAGGAGQIPTIVDLFAGAGGLTMGFVMAGYRPIFAVENDADAAATYEANFGGHCHREDIQDREEFPKADLIIGGPPCQGF